MNLIAILEQEEIARLTGGKAMPAFAPGDTVVVSVNVVEGTRKRVQAFEGVVIAKRNRGLNSAFTVRKISSGEAVERMFQLYSPQIAGIEVKRRGACAAPSCTTCATARASRLASRKSWSASKPRRLDRLSAHGPICVGRSRFPAFSSDTDFRLKGTCEGAFSLLQSRMSDSSSSPRPRRPLARPVSIRLPSPGSWPMIRCRPCPPACSRRRAARNAEPAFHLEARTLARQ